MNGECDKCGKHALECECKWDSRKNTEKYLDEMCFLDEHGKLIKNYSLSEMIEMAKNSDYGTVWYSEKGPIQITKEGKLEPI